MKKRPISFIEWGDLKPPVISQDTLDIPASDPRPPVDEYLEETLQQVKEKLQDPEFGVFLRQLESLGALRDMTRYGVQAWEHYITRWDHIPPLLQSETSP